MHVTEAGDACMGYVEPSGTDSTKSSLSAYYLSTEKDERFHVRETIHSNPSNIVCKSAFVNSRMMLCPCERPALRAVIELFRETSGSDPRKNHMHTWVPVPT